MRSLFPRLAALSVFAVAIAGCGGSSGTALPAVGSPNNGQASTNQFVANSSGTGAVRFLNGSPDAGNVDICFDRKVVVANLGYRAFSSFSIVPSGIAHTLVVTAAGTGCAQVSAFFNGVVTPGVNLRNTIVLAGTVAKGDVQVLPFAAPPSPAAGLPQVWFGNASPTSPASLVLGNFIAATGTNSMVATSTFGFNSGFNYKLPLPASASNSAQGIGFSIGTTVSAPLASLYAGTIPAVAFPTAATANTADPNNTSNQIPSGANDVLLDGFVIDAPAGGTSPALIVGTYDSTALGF